MVIPVIDMLSKVWERMKIMKTFIIILVSVITLSSFSLALGLRIGGTVNYYVVEDPVFKDTYGQGNIMYGLFLGFEVTRRFELRAEANYFQDKGEMTLTKEEISLTLKPVILGLRLRLIDVGLVSLYLGGGAGFYSYTENLPDRFEDISDSTIGYHGEGGVYVSLVPKFFLDVNVRYSIANAEPFEETAKLGGFRAGVGFGLSF